jgi:hypothetical protein
MIFPKTMPHDDHEAPQNLPVSPLLTNSPALWQSGTTVLVRWYQTALFLGTFRGYIEHVQPVYPELLVE